MERTLKSYSELRFTDDFMFCRVMTANPDLCRELLELILDVKIRRIEFPESQKELRPTYDGKGIRLDVYVEDDQNTVYDIEMQTSVRNDLAKRIRYYQGMIDLNLIKRGEQYKRLKQTYIILICCSDPFGKNLPVYHFKNICREDKTVELDDQTNKVIINAAGTRSGLSGEMAAFLDYLRCNVPESDFTERIHRQVDRHLRQEDWRVEYMTWAMELMDIKDEMREELREEIREELREEVRTAVREEVKDEVRKEVKDRLSDTARSMKADGLSSEKISQYTGLSVSEIEKLPLMT